MDNSYRVFNSVNISKEKKKKKVGGFFDTSGMKYAT